MGVELVNQDGTPMRDNPDVETLECGCWRGPRGSGGCEFHSGRFGFDPWPAHVAAKLNARIAAYESALDLIAASKRPDGTYNRSREACEQLAKEVLAEWRS